MLATTCYAQKLEDEPSELNWDTLGGTTAAFADFAEYVQSHPDYRKRLLARKPSNIFKRSTAAPKRVENVWVGPEAFSTDGGWGVAQVEETPVISYPSGHGGGTARALVTIPRAGYYRVWAAYRHEFGTSATFVMRLEDPRVLKLTGAMQTIPQDVFTWKYDAAEMSRRNPLPTRRDEPTGTIWESSPLVWLEKGERALTIAGTIHDGPFATRAIAAIVLTQEPVAIPTMSAQSASKLTSAEARIWERRPVAGCDDPELVKLWSEWRESFFAKLASDETLGVELDRMKSWVAFDPESNLLGAPKQIADEKKRFAAALADAPAGSFTQKIEGEDFTIAEGWYVDGSADASAGKILMANYGDAYAAADHVLDIPRAGEYSIWSRVIELPGYLSRFMLEVYSGDEKISETTFCNDEEFNKTSPGARWLETKCALPKGKVKLTLRCAGGPGLTYRRYDCAIVTDRAGWTPEGRGEIVPPRRKEALTLWESDPWAGNTRLDSPKDADVISKPIEVELPYGAVVSRSLLIRNDGDSARVLRPTLTGANDVVSWRLQALTLSPDFGWVPHVLLDRETVTVPPRQTVALWLTFDGDKVDTPKKFTCKLALDDKTVEYHVARKGDLRDAPIPYIGGWSSPYELLSCWDAFKRLGVNVLNDMLVDSKEAERYGIKLFVKLNDSDVSEEHIAAVVKSFQDYGYDYDSWAWSFMDEPGATMSDGWVELAKKFKAANDKIRVWCNPGEYWGAPAESDLKMLPYVDCYCPYADHYWQNGGGNADYLKELQGNGRKYAIRLTYTTPCFGEKAPGAPNEMFSPCGTAIGNDLDGWMFYVLMGRYEYCNSLWDEVNAYMADQAVSLYPGVGGKTLYTRTAEAIRAARDMWRKAKLEKQNSVAE